MATLWTICGARRGVGKTHLALALCKLLPDAVYAKLSHCQAHPGKPANMFGSEADIEAFIDGHADGCQHIVVEANALARKCRGDVIIFIDGIPGQENLREDREELRQRSHVAVSPGADVHGWKSELQTRAELADPEMIENVFDLLTEQRLFLSREVVACAEARLKALGLGERIDEQIRADDQP